VIARLDIEPRLVAEGDAAAQVDAEVIRGPIADDLVD
jgi:hypothetical protein